MPQHKVVCFGEILWDVLPSGAKPGGAPMNVAYHLNNMGLYSAVISTVGKDKWGDDLIQILKGWEITTAYMQTSSQHPTGLVNAHVKENNEVEYDIVFPAAWDFIQANEELIKLVGSSDYFVFGSLAARNEATRNTLHQLLEVANTKVLDINLRPPHFSQQLVKELLSKADILKLNDHEVKLISAWYQHADDIEEQINIIQDKFSIPTILVTCGAKGAIVQHANSFYKHEGFKVKVADTIGSGDAFLAGFLSKYSAGATIDEALIFANKLGSFIATQEGACPTYNPAQLQ